MNLRLLCAMMVFLTCQAFASDRGKKYDVAAFLQPCNVYGYGYLDAVKRVFGAQECHALCAGRFQA